MNHPTEEDLIQHYYSENDAPFETEQHLAECAGCRESYASLQQVLNSVDAIPVPERAADYEEQLWQRLEAKLPARRRFWLRGGSPWRLAASAAAVAAMLVCAFLAGRLYPVPSKAGAAAVSDPRLKQAVLLVAMDDYLERSQMVLVELANAAPDGPLDITSEQERAADLITENRLYRQTADKAGEASMISVLDELERVLIEITHAPARISPEQLAQLRETLRGEGILFKMRVLSANVRNQLDPAVSRAGQKL